MSNVGEIDLVSINSVMGANWYEKKFGFAEEDFLAEQERAMQNIDRLSAFWHTTSRCQLEADLETLEKAFDDCTAELCEISRLWATQQVAVAKSKRLRVSGMFRVLTAALKLLNVENWTLQDLHSYGVINGLLRISLNQIREKAAAALKTMKSLETKLMYAQKLRGQSMDQLKINALLAVISPLIIPAGPIAILASAAIGVGQLILDESIGVSTSAAASWGGGATNAAGVYSVAMTEILSVNQDHLKALKFAKLGKKLAFLGVAFDLNEVLEAGKNEAAALAEFEKAAKDWQKLAEFVDLNDEIIDDIVRKNKLARKETEKRGLANIQSARSTLASEIKSTGYDPARN